MQRRLKQMTRTIGKISAEKSKQCENWVEDNIKENSIRSLVNMYWRHSIVLYVGAGISTAKPINGKKYGIPTWLDLLQQVSNKPKSGHWPSDPWLAADEAVRLSGGVKQFKRRLENIIQSTHNYRGNGQLNGRFLSQAPTLTALAAFCGQFTSRLTNPKMKNPRLVHFQTSVNPRINAILTANYDCFLESAASNLYRKSPLKPVTALGSMAGSSNRIPVFHIHGYVPHPLHYRDREQTIPDLIITRDDYEKYWNPKDVFGTTMGPQIHYLRYFTVLFVGFSFSDKYVCRLLRRINKDYLCRGGRTHFALLPAEQIQRKGESFFLDMGVTPIMYQRHEEISSVIGQVYKSGLATERIIAAERPVDLFPFPELVTEKHIPTGKTYYYQLDDIWEIAKACRNESINANMARKLEIKEESLHLRDASSMEDNDTA